MKFNKLESLWDCGDVFRTALQNSMEHSIFWMSEDKECVITTCDHPDDRFAYVKILCIAHNLIEGIHCHKDGTSAFVAKELMDLFSDFQLGPKPPWLKDYVIELFIGMGTPVTLVSFKNYKDGNGVKA